MPAIAGSLHRRPGDLAVAGRSGLSASDAGTQHVGWVVPAAGSGDRARRSAGLAGGLVAEPELLEVVEGFQEADGGRAGPALLGCGMQAGRGARLGTARLQ